MEVAGDACAGVFRYVNPYVEPVGFQYGFQQALRLGDRAEQVVEFSVIELVEAADMPLGRNHEMAVVIRINVKETGA